MAKKFLLKASEIRDLLPIRIGGCIATDMITVKGKKVGFMFRGDPSTDRPDSGWQFLAGEESQDYLDDPDNSGIYDVNTIANCDPDIVPLVYSAPGSAFERKTPSSPLTPCEGTKASGYAAGAFQLTEDWRIHLPQPCCVRLENGSLVVWRTGLTLWISAFSNASDTRQTMLADVATDAPSTVQNYEISEEATLTRFRYEAEEHDPNRTPSKYTCLMSHTFSDDGNRLMMGIYCDTAAALDLARSIHQTVVRV